jgi:hypothetical protein
LPLADLLIDHGVDLLVMAVNRHLGNHVDPRPGIFRWKTPSSRELRVVNGNPYTRSVHGTFARFGIPSHRACRGDASTPLCA